MTGVWTDQGENRSRAHWRALFAAAALHLGLFALLQSAQVTGDSEAIPLAVELWPGAEPQGGTISEAPRGVQQDSAFRRTPSEKHTLPHRAKAAPATVEKEPRSAVAPTTVAGMDSAAQYQEPRGEVPVGVQDRSGAVQGVGATTQGVIVPARFDAAYLNNPAPEYPPVARRRGEEGRVLLSVAVCPAGWAERIEVRASSGSPRLDRAALEAVRRWRFVPANQNGVAVASRIVVPIVFRLDG